MPPGSDRPPLATPLSETTTRMVLVWAKCLERTNLFAGEPCANQLAATAVGRQVEGQFQRYKFSRWPANVEGRQACPWFNGRLCEVQRRSLRVAATAASRSAVFTTESWVGYTPFNFVETFTTRRSFAKVMSMLFRATLKRAIKWHLPHHVINPRKPGKVRVVFDCVAKW